MEAEALRSAVEHAGLAAAGIGFIAGLAFGFNPVALASIPVSLAYVTKGRDKAEALLFGAMFILGMVLTHVVLGFIAGLGGKWAAEITGRAWGLLLGPLLIVLGLMWAGWLRIPLPSFGFRATRTDRRVGCVPSRDSVCDRRMPGVHTGPGRAAWRYGRNRLGLARGGSAVCIRCRPSRPDCSRRIRRELAREPKEPLSLPARLRDRRRPHVDCDGALHAERRPVLDTPIGVIEKAGISPTFVHASNSLSGGFRSHTETSSLRRHHRGFAAPS